MSGYGVVNTWAALLAAITWQLAALAALGWLCERALRLRDPRLRQTLWWFVLIAPFMLAPGRLWLEQRQAVVPVAAPTVVARAMTYEWMPAPGVVTAAPAPPASAHLAASSLPWWSQLRLVDVAAWAWMLGFAFLLVRFLVGCLRLRRMLRESKPLPQGEAWAALTALRAEAGLRRELPLRVSAAVGAPVLAGLFRPVILVPSEWTASLSPEEVRALLAHEVAHVKRRDLLANLLQRLLEVPLFFHPGAWLASGRIALAREELADAWALARGVHASSYATSLAAAAERGQPRLRIASVGLAEGKSHLFRRVEAIMRAERVKRVSRPLSIALMVVALGAAGTFAAVHVHGKPIPALSPNLPSGIHLKYRVTTEEFALPQDVIDSRMASMKRSEEATAESIRRELKGQSPKHIEETLALNLAAEEKVRLDQRRRIVAGPTRTAAAEYWGTNRGFMYTDMSYAMAYDGKKVVEGSAYYMVPELLNKPINFRSGLEIMDTSRDRVGQPALFWRVPARTLAFQRQSRPHQDEETGDR